MAHVPLGARRHYVDLADVVVGPDGDGGFSDGPPVPLDPPRWACAIRAAGAADQERARGGTVTASATHVLEGAYHPGIGLQTRITFGARVLSVIYVGDPDGRGVDLDVLASERV